MRGVRLVPLALFVAFCAAGVALFVEANALDPPDPTLEGTATYGRNHPGELRFILTLAAAEAAVALALLRPWSYRRSWFRAFTALCALTPWFLLVGVGGMHAGTVTARHLVWLAAGWVSLLVTAVVSGVSARRAMRRQPLPHA